MTRSPTCEPWSPVAWTWYTVRGRPYRRKIDVGLDAVRHVLPCLDPRIDRVGVAGVAYGYTTYQHPVSDTPSVARALAKVRSATLTGAATASNVFASFAAHFDALHLHSEGRPQLTIALTDGADTSKITGADAGRLVRAYLSAAPDRGFWLLGCGQNESLDYAQLGGLKRAGGGRVEVLRSVFDIAPVVRQALYHATMTVTGRSVQTETVSLEELRLALRVERRGIDLLLLLDTSASMGNFTSA